LRIGLRVSRPGTQLPPAVPVQQAIDTIEPDLLPDGLPNMAMNLFRGEHLPTPGLDWQRRRQLRRLV